MLNDAVQIARIRMQIRALIAWMTANPKPTYMIEDQLFTWDVYLKQLQETVEWCDEKLAELRGKV